METKGKKERQEQEHVILIPVVEEKDCFASLFKRNCLIHIYIYIAVPKYYLKQRQTKPSLILVDQIK